MADTTLKVTTTKLSGDAASAADRVTSLQEALSTIRESVERLNGMWEGKSKEAFVQAAEDDIEEAESILKEMSGLCEYDRKAASSYESCERTIESLIGQIRL